jgi:hypothetical protein
MTLLSSLNTDVDGLLLELLAALSLAPLLALLLTRAHGARIVRRLQSLQLS